MRVGLGRASTPLVRLTKWTDFRLLPAVLPPGTSRAAACRQSAAATNIARETQRKPLLLGGGGGGIIYRSCLSPTPGGSQDALPKIAKFGDRNPRHNLFLKKLFGLVTKLSNGKVTFSCRMLEAQSPSPTIADAETSPRPCAPLRAWGGLRRRACEVDSMA